MDKEYIKRLYDSIENPKLFMPFSIELDIHKQIPDTCFAFDRHHDVKFMTKEELLKTLPKGTWVLPTHGIADPEGNGN